MTSEPERPKPLFDDRGNFAGYTARDCTEHRTVGVDRAWCYDCGQDCSPYAPCQGCELAILRPTDGEP